MLDDRNLVRHIKRVLVLVDESNVVGSAKLLNKRIDWPKLRDALVYGNKDQKLTKDEGQKLMKDEVRELVEMVVYVGLPPVAETWAEARKKKLGFVHYLRTQGFLVVTKDGTPRGEDYKANVDVLMGIDAMALANRMEPDIVVLVTGDADFAHLATELRRRGIRVEVAATRAALGAQLQSSANRVVVLDDLLATFEDLYAEESREYFHDDNHRVNY